MIAQPDTTTIRDGSDCRRAALDAAAPVVRHDADTAEQHDV